MSTGPGQYRSSKAERERKTANLIGAAIEVAPLLLSPLEVLSSGTTSNQQVGLVLRNRETGRKYRITVEECDK